MDLTLGHCGDILQVRKTILVLSAAKIVPKIIKIMTRRYTKHEKRKLYLDFEVIKC